MNTSRDMEPTNGNEVVSPPFSKPIATHESGNHSASFLNIMKKTVLHHKIPYWNENETKGDGNCFYNAIIDQIQNNPGVYDTLSEDAKRCSTPSELRAAVITFVASWPPVLSENETMNQWRLSIDWQSYLDEHAQLGTYADDLMIHCTATFLGKDIYVTTKQNNRIWRHMNSHSGTRGTPITLANDQSSEKDENGQFKIGGEHFQSLIPVLKSGETENCRNCGQQNIKRLKSHLNNSKRNCAQMYDMALMEAQAKAKLQEKRREASAKYREANKESLRIKQAEYDSQNRGQKRQKQAEYDSQHRPEKRQKQAEYDSQHTPQKLKRQAENYKQNTPQKLKRQAEYDSKHKQEKKARDATSLEFLKKNQGKSGRIKDFRQSQREGLTFVCASCCRLWFGSSVVDVKNKRCKLSPDILDPLKTSSGDKLPSTLLCGTCKKYLKAKKLPPLAAKNGLSIESMPEELKLSELEAVLCSRNIIFVKIHSLPKNWSKGTKDRVVNVPINSDDLRNTFDKITTFPRQPSEGGLLPVPVQFKRKLSYKGNHLARNIDPERVVGAAQHFKDTGHPLYQEMK